MQCNLLSFVVLSLTYSTLLKISWKIIKRTEDNLRVFYREHAACSKASLTSSTCPGSCKICFFHMPVFGGKVSFIFLTIDLIVDLNLICINGLSDLVSPLIFADSCPGWHNYPVLTGLTVNMSNSLSLLIDFTEIRPVLASSTSIGKVIGGPLFLNSEYWNLYLYLSDLIMSKPVFLMTVQEAHKEYNSIIDQIRAK